MNSKTKTATKATARTGVWQGMNWITQKKRQGVILDHLKPHSKNGSNHESNLASQQPTFSATSA
jgi:hypothetical protein